MEIVVQGVESVPEGAVLSIKIGETKRQAPASKIGQPFRFTSSPSEPLPAKFELLTQARPAQTRKIDPTQERFVVDFGLDTRISLLQREVAELQPPVANVKEVAAARGLPAEKFAVAQSAAKYLEQHNLVRTIQDILHGLLVSRPEDPFQYFDEHLSRAKGLATQRTAKNNTSRLKVESLSLDQRLALEALFMRWDSSKSGAVEMKQFKAVIAALGRMEGDEDSLEQKIVAAVGVMETYPEFSKTFEDSSSKLSQGFFQDCILCVISEIAERPVDLVIGKFRELLRLRDPGNDKPQDRGSARSSLARSSRSSLRGSIVSRTKVETLLDILLRTQQNTHLVMPFLPDSLKTILSSEELEKECMKRFAELDKSNTGQLEPKDLSEIIMQLSTAKLTSISSDQCKRFAEIFDVNQTGFIRQAEFLDLTRFVLIAAHLESDEGKSQIEMAQSESTNFADFLSMLEGDKDRVNDVVPFLPDWLVSHLTSDSFMDDCMDHFDKLDVDCKDALQPGDLLPVVLSLSKVDARALGKDKLTEFVQIFDVHKDGVILRDEFIEFAQFLTVMNFLSCTEEGQHVSQAARFAADTKRIEAYIEKLRKDPSKVGEVLDLLPKSFAEDLMNEGFAKECIEGFQEIDLSKHGVLEPMELYPLITKLGEPHPISVGLEAFKMFVTMFDKERNGIVTTADCVLFVQFTLVMAFLMEMRESQDETVKQSREKIEELLAYLKAHCDKLDEVLPLLPDDMQVSIMSQEFVSRCIDDFERLDTDNSGVLEPKELISLVIEMSAAHPFALTQSQCNRFVDLFDTERNGVISCTEFIQFARFLLVMSFLETEEGQVVSENADIAIGGRRVEQLLCMLEKDRSTVHKVVPLLPKDVFEHLTSDGFVASCHERFLELDKDQDGVLNCNELFPVVVELSEAHPFSVDFEQCRRFTAIFDIHNDGVIQMDEFLDFARFLCIMSYLYSEEGKEKLDQGLHIMADSKQIDDLLSALRSDRRELRAVIPYMPASLRDELLCKAFTMNCLKRFNDLDKNGNGSLDPMELFPLIIEMTNANRLSLDEAQCREFTDIFDDAKTGVISKTEFVNFARFVMVMSYLQTEDGRKVLELSGRDERQNDPQAAVEDRPQARAGGARPGAPGPGANNDGGRGGLSTPEAGHISVDLEFYRNKSNKLVQENGVLRSQVSSLEDTIRVMEMKIEEQEMRLRHAEVDIRNSRQRCQ